MELIKIEPKKRKELANKGRDEFFELLTRAYIEKRTFTRKEAFDCYKDNVGTGHLDYGFEKSDGTWINVNTKWSDYEWNRNFEAWFTRTLGKLIIEGRLHAIPNIDMSRNNLTPPKE